MGKIRTIFDFRNIFLHYICVNLVVMKKRKGKNGVEEQVVKLRKSKEPVIESEIINISDLPYDLQQKLKLSEKQYSEGKTCLLYTSPSPRDRTRSRMPSSA